MSEITIGTRTVGPGHKVLVVAELGGNAAGDFSVAAALVRAAADAGADCVKVQVFAPGEMTLPCATPPFCLSWAGKRRTLWDLYSDTAMPLEWHESLKALADSLGILYFGSVFDQIGIELAVRLGFPALKIASFELMDLPLIRAAATTGKPLILSTGMATQQEIGAALTAASSEGNDACAILKCTSAYPAPVSDANLRTIFDPRYPYALTEHRMVPLPLIDWMGFYPIGLSDHSRSNAVVSAAVAIGACIVERHLKLSQSDDGPDAAFSDTPTEFAAMVRAIRETEAALGTVHYGPTESERPMLRFRRSLWVVQDIAVGERITAANVRCLRPADGLEPKHYHAVMGRRAQVAVARGSPLTWEVVE